MIITTIVLTIIVTVFVLVKWLIPYWDSLVWYRYEYYAELDLNPDSSTVFKRIYSWRLIKIPVRRPIYKVLLKIE